MAVAVSLALVGCSGADDSGTETTNSAPATTTPPPTPEEEAVEAATAVFEAYDALDIAASMQPGVKDWEPEIRQYAGDPFAFTAVRQLREHAASQVASSGTRESTVLESDVSLTPTATVTLTVCVDATEWDFIYVPTGEVLDPFTESGEPPPDRYTQTYIIQRYDEVPGTPWLINGGEILLDQPC